MKRPAGSNPPSGQAPVSPEGLSDRAFRLLVDSTEDYAIFVLDPVGHVLTWNAGAQRIKGYSASEIIGSHFSRFYTQEDAASGKPDLELENAARAGKIEDDGWRVRKDGSRFWASVVITALYDDTGTLVGFGKVTRDLTERKRADEIRDQFIANAAHELRTPIASILGFTEILTHPEPISEAKMQEALAALQRAGLRLTKLVDNLLDISWIEQAKVRLRLESVDLVRAVGSAIDAAGAMDVSVRIPDGLAVEADSERLQQILVNLLTNARRYGGRNLSVDARRDGDVAVVTVADEGHGVPDAIVDTLFEPFTRGENIGGQLGSGLGLSIVRSIVEAHGGHIHHERNEPSGARFVFSLPAAS
jgi:PAS domain S-box-containing protein